MQPVETAASPSETLIPGRAIPTAVMRMRRNSCSAATFSELLELAELELATGPHASVRLGRRRAIGVLQPVPRGERRTASSWSDSGDLWAWLLQVTFNKLRGRVAHHLAEKRSVKKEEQLLITDDSGDHVAPDLWFDRPFSRGSGGDRRRAGFPLRIGWIADCAVLFDLRLQGFTMEEIGERLGTSHTTVSRHLKKIGRRFEERLRDQSKNDFRDGAENP